MAEEKKEVIEDIKEKSERKQKLKYLAVPVAAVLIAAAVFLAWPENYNTPEQYASAGSDTVHETGLEASKVYNITDEGVAPASHTVQLGKAVGFRNKLRTEVSISFDRSNDTLNLKPGESKTVYINGITYFQVSGRDYSASGRVNVQ